MKPIYIIIKDPDDGNPLDLEKGRPAIPGRMTVGYKFQKEDSDEWYGDYVDMSVWETTFNITEAVALMLKQARTTQISVNLEI